jgi:hypothetical protein
LRGAPLTDAAALVDGFGQDGTISGIVALDQNLHLHIEKK